MSPEVPTVSRNRRTTLSHVTAVATLAGAPCYEVEIDWNRINWKKVNRNVRRLQAYIVKAVKEKRWGKVKALQ